MQSFLDQLLYMDSVPFDAQINQDTGEATVQIDLPGVKKNDLSIEVKDSVIQIKANRETKKENGPLKPSIQRRWSKQSLNLQVPEDLDPETLKASFENGVLDLSIQQKESAKPKTVEIQFS